MSKSPHPRRQFKRRKAFKAPRECILIVCEGAKTEPLYFENLRRKLRLTTVEVDIQGEECGSAAISVVDHAIIKRDQRKNSHSLVQPEYHAVWCVMDVEIPQDSSLSKALNKAKANDLEVALSNPCFEFWLLLHFVKTGKLFQSSKEVSKELKKHYPHYAKGDGSIFHQIYSDTDQAMTNAEAILEEKGCSEDLQDCNPSTHVHRLVQELRQVNDGSAK